MDNRMYPQEGADVFGMGGEKVGTVKAVDTDYIVVEKGFFFPSDYYIPYSFISGVSDEGVFLSITKDEALSQDWGAVPSTGVEQGFDTSASAYEGTDADRAGRAYDTQAQGGDLEHGRGETVAQVPVHEEELVARARQAEAGEVTISKDVVTEQETIEVPVREERVRVDYRAPSGDATGTEHAFEEGTIEVPVTREEVDVQKRVKQVGEVDVTKEGDERTEQVTDTIRKERVDVDEAVAGERRRR
jgi:uncharacterized protein (TIGR02271 family)